MKMNPGKETIYTATQPSREEFLRQQAIQARCFHPSGEWEEFPPSVLAGSIVARFEEMVARYPERAAVTTRSAALTYAELNRAANCVAYALMASKIDRTKPVVLFLPLGVEMVIAVIAVLKAGLFSVTLDPTAPPTRNQWILADAQAQFIIVNRQTAGAKLGTLASDMTVLNLTELPTHLPTQDFDREMDPNETLRIVYTSGSTGTPKGVIQTHRGVFHDAVTINQVTHLSKEDTLLYHSLGGLGHILRPLLAGGTVCPFDLNSEGMVQMIARLQEAKISILHTTPTVFRHLAGALTGAESFPDLRLVIFGGEAVRREHVLLFQCYLAPHCILLNLLGSQESLYYRYFYWDHASPLPEDRLPAGYPLDDTTSWVIDEEGQPVERDQMGEIVVRSRYIAPGYWRRPDLTQDKFAQCRDGSPDRLCYTGDLGLLRADGCLLYLGRKDRQVKMHGFRVEIAEVEAALHRFAQVQSALVQPVVTTGGDQFLVAYVAVTQPAPTLADLRRGLAATLPVYMIPTRFVLLDAMPLTPSGKIDRQALPAWQSVRPSIDTLYAAPRTPLEETLVAIWQEVLDVEPVGIHDHFLDWGGNSLRAMQVHTRLVNQIQGDLPARLLFECATVAEMALLITQQQAAQVDQAALAQLLTALEADSTTEFQIR